MSDAFPTYPTLKDDGVTITSYANEIDFIGSGVSVNQLSPGKSTVTIPGVSGTGAVTALVLSDTSSTININQPETTMQSATIPANTLNVDAKTLRYHLHGNYRCSLGDLTIRGKFAGQTLFTIPTGLLGNSGSSFDIVFTITRTSGANASGSLVFIGSDQTSLTVNAFPWCSTYTLSGVNWTVSNTMLTTAQTGATGIITYLNMQVELLGN